MTIEEFEACLDENLERPHQVLRENTYQPQAVRRLEIPERGAPGKTRPLGIDLQSARPTPACHIMRVAPAPGKDQFAGLDIVEVLSAK